MRAPSWGSVKHCPEFIRAISFEGQVELIRPLDKLQDPSHMISIFFPFSNDSHHAQIAVKILQR